MIKSCFVRLRAPCNGRLQTPPGPEGSNGSGLARVPRITRGLAILQLPSMYQVIARKYRPADVLRADQPGARPHHARERHRAEPHRARLHLLRAARDRQDHRRAHHRALPELRSRAHARSRAACARAAARSQPAARVDVIEIDAASNRGINEMRELRENVRYRPARDRYKVFIIDEAHQITNEAFNALLKTLEEPPEWVVFILCTTESHKIPDDHRIALPAVQLPLGRFRGTGRAHASGSASRKASRPTTKRSAVLAQAGEGSVRDSLSALDQAIACCGTTLSAQRKSARCSGCSRSSRCEQVTEALERGDSRRMLEIVQELERNGQNLQHFCRELARYFRNLLVARDRGRGHATDRRVGGGAGSGCAKSPRGSAKKI